MQKTPAPDEKVRTPPPPQEQTESPPEQDSDSGQSSSGGDDRSSKAGYSAGAIAGTFFGGLLLGVIGIIIAVKIRKKRSIDEFYAGARVLLFDFALVAAPSGAQTA